GAHGDEVLPDERGHHRVAVGRLVHDVAPVAPARGEIEEDEAMLGAGALEDVVGPGLEVDGEQAHGGPGEHHVGITGGGEDRIYPPAFAATASSRIFSPDSPPTTFWNGTRNWRALLTTEASCFLNDSAAMPSS